MNWLIPLLSVIAQTEEAPVPQRPIDPTFMIMILMFLGFYVFLIAPQRRRQRETERMLSSIKKGDRVIFAQGIYGTVREIEEKTDEKNPRAPKLVLLTVEVDKNTRLTVRRESVSHVLSE
ncbi:preprotein translocase subunit YajC [bacterium]|nr:preprotein translocase subunit YajC [bacterium]